MLETEDIGYRCFDGLKRHAKNTLTFSNSFGYPSCWQYAQTFEFPSIVLSSKCMITFVIRSIVWQTSSDKTLIRVATHCCFLLCFKKKLLKSGQSNLSSLLYDRSLCKLFPSYPEIIKQTCTYIYIYMRQSSRL